MSPCSLIERTGAPVVTSTRSWYSASEWAQSPLHLEYLTFGDEILMGFPTGTLRSLRILLPREEGSRFGQRELTLMELLLPHLENAFERLGVQSRTAAVAVAFAEQGLTDQAFTG